MIKLIKLLWWILFMVIFNNHKASDRIIVHPIDDVSSGDCFAKAETQLDKKRRVIIGRVKFTEIPNKSEGIFQIVWTHDGDLLSLRKKMISEVIVDNNQIKAKTPIYAYIQRTSYKRRYVFFELYDPTLIDKSKKNIFYHNNLDNNLFPGNQDLQLKYNGARSILGQSLNSNYVYEPSMLLDSYGNKKRDINEKDGIRFQDIDASNKDIDKDIEMNKNVDTSVDRSIGRIIDKDIEMGKNIDASVDRSIGRIIDKDMGTSKNIDKNTGRSIDNNIGKDKGIIRSTDKHIEIVKNIRKEKNKKPDLRTVSTVVTSDGCRPRVDAMHDRVIIRSRVLTYEEGQLTKESPCEDTWNHYPIKRDYLCKKCDYEFDLLKKQAYAQYQKYWIDDSGKRQLISSKIFHDTEKPLNIIEESTQCPLLISLQENLIYLQKMSFFIGYFNEKVILKSCHRILNKEPLSIQWTSEGCALFHDMRNKVSMLRERAIYVRDGHIHTLSSCQARGVRIPHLWDESVCPKKIDFRKNQFITTARRYVIINGQKKWVSQNCEPYGQTQSLLSTHQGCEGQYHHDCTNQRSYLFKRYYYIYQNAPLYVTGCLVSDQFFKHQIVSSEFEHEDHFHRSRKLIKNILATPDEKIMVHCPSENTEPIKHQLIETIDHLTDEYFYDKCVRYTKTKRMKIYQRPDKTTYQSVSGPGKTLKGPDECKRETEYRNVFDHSLLYNRETGKMIQKVTAEQAKKRIRELSESYGAYAWKKHFSDVDGSRLDRSHIQKLHRYYRQEKRVVTEFPDGNVQIGVWKNTGILVQHDGKQ